MTPVRCRKRTFLRSKRWWPYLRIGPASIITNPGELTSELFLGGYDGSLAGTYPLFDPRKANAPDLSLAPLPPYLIDRMHGFVNIG